MARRVFLNREGGNPRCPPYVFPRPNGRPCRAGRLALPRPRFRSGWSVVLVDQGSTSQDGRRYPRLDGRFDGGTIGDVLGDDRRVDGLEGREIEVFLQKGYRVERSYGRLWSCTVFRGTRASPRCCVSSFAPASMGPRSGLT